MSIKQLKSKMLNGRHEFRLYPQHEDGEFTGYQVSFIDAECDPITVNIDCDGLATVPNEDYKYAMMDAHQLRRLADACDLARAIGYPEMHEDEAQ